MSTSTWNPERQDPRLGDSVPCPTPEERVAIEDREAEVRLRGEEHVVHTNVADVAEHMALLEVSAATDRETT